jgi:hypothetical protein
MRRLTAFLTALTIALLSASVAGEARAPAYEIIVSPSNSIAAVDREFLAEAFLKKSTEWPSGETVKPVDLPPSSPVRRRFSDDVLHRSVAEVKSYWQQRIFAGRDTPPPELDGDDDVVHYVLKHPGAVGYVSVGAALAGAKVVAIR